MEHDLSDCNLRCSHCYLDANALTKQSANELSTQEGYKLIDQMAEAQPKPVIDTYRRRTFVKKRHLRPILYASQKRNDGSTGNQWGMRSTMILPRNSKDAGNGGWHQSS